MIYSALLLGFLGSLHCIGMCGPIAFMLPVDHKNSSKKVAQVGLYHIGRIISYSIIGLIFGLLGKSLYIFGLQQQLSNCSVGRSRTNKQTKCLRHYTFRGSTNESASCFVAVVSERENTRNTQLRVNAFALNAWRMHPFREISQMYVL